MSACTFIASDCPLPESAPSQFFPISINMETGAVSDGDADDNYYLTVFSDVDCYTYRKYAVTLQWNCTEARAERILKYIQNALHQTDEVELWHVWLTGYCEFEERPVIHRQTIDFSQLTTTHIREIDRAEIWNKPDKQYPERPSFYCMTICRDF